MFEKLFGKNDAENPEIKEPETPVETKRMVGIDPQTGVVMTEKEVKEEIKNRQENPDHFRDLR